MFNVWCYERVGRHKDNEKTNRESRHKKTYRRTWHIDIGAGRII